MATRKRPHAATAPDRLSHFVSSNRRRAPRVNFSRRRFSGEKIVDRMRFNPARTDTLPEEMAHGDRKWPRVRGPAAMAGAAVARYDGLVLEHAGGANEKTLQSRQQTGQGAPPKGFGA